MGKVTQMTWGSDAVGGDAVVQSITTPLRSFTTAASDRLVASGVTLASGQGLPVEGLPGPLATSTPHGRFGHPTTFGGAGRSGTMAVNDRGDVTGTTLTGNAVSLSTSASHDAGPRSPTESNPA